MIYSDHLELVSRICPNLKRLNFFADYNCLKDYVPLLVIVIIYNEFIWDTSENHMQLWEILSSMKLTHLEVESCIIIPFEGGIDYKQNLSKMF